MRISIRELMLITAIVALAVAWWVDHRQIVTLKHERDEALYDATFFAKHGSFRHNVGSNGEIAAVAQGLLAKYNVDRSAVTYRDAMRADYIRKLEDVLRKSLNLSPSDDLPQDLRNEPE